LNMGDLATCEILPCTQTTLQVASHVSVVVLLEVPPKCELSLQNVYIPKGSK
jgi:hypothetical protein